MVISSAEINETRRVESTGGHMWGLIFIQGGQGRPERSENIHNTDIWEEKVSHYILGSWG